MLRAEAITQAAVALTTHLNPPWKLLYMSLPIFDPVTGSKQTECPAAALHCIFDKQSFA